MSLWASGGTSPTLSVPICKMGLTKPTSQAAPRREQDGESPMKASVMAPGAVESQAGGVPVTKAVLRAVGMSGTFPAGKAFSEARPKGQEGRSPLLPVLPWPHCYFFQL